MRIPYPLVPAKAGIQSSGRVPVSAGYEPIPDAAWVPAFAGMSGWGERGLPHSPGGNAAKQEAGRPGGPTGKAKNE
ncbi:hypothetical protein SAMN02982931_02037 [Bauldia litoralis]|uniref:Uncharacterized protein n=1 Tax=Bauldia litoralis TaxID=665467 RepID=A0A1G6BZ87_9HYPH|nr:hypothetical protein SAMN02982931_02037 [Bauldia litoralis]